MILETYDRLKDPLRLRSTRVVIKDSFGQIVAVFWQVATGHVRYIHVGEPDFQNHLVAMGLDRTVVLSRHDVGQIKPPEIGGGIRLR